MNTKYGKVSPIDYKQYLSSLNNRIWKLIPLKQEGYTSIDSCIERINRELLGFLNVYTFISNNHKDYIFSIINLLENAKVEKDFQNYRSDILRCCRLVDKLYENGDTNV